MTSGVGVQVRRGQLTPLMARGAITAPVGVRRRTRRGAPPHEPATSGLVFASLNPPQFWDHPDRRRRPLAAEKEPPAMIPTGSQIPLEHGGFRAVVTELGACLRELSWQGRSLILGFAPDELPVAYQGAVLAPWPNRVADGRYTFQGRTHQLALSEPDRGNALHGLVIWTPWQFDRLDAAAVRLSHRLWPQPGYPFRLDLEVVYRLTDDGLTFALTVINSGDSPAPYGGSFHPYLVAGPGDVDGWTVQSPAAAYLTVDPDRLLPRAVVPVDEFDFRSPTSLRGVEVDHAFTDVAFDEAGAAALTLVDDSGQGVRLAWDRRCRWLQLCIPGAQRPRLHRKALAVEPMSCPPDAFNSGIDLIVLAPGDSHTLELTIGAIDA